jgi:hypothetical protein
LKNFADVEKKVFLNSTDGLALRNVKSATTILDYYSECHIQDDFEKKLNRIETKVSGIVMKLAQNKVCLISESEKKDLFDFIKMTYARSPRGRKLVSEVGGVLKEHEFVEARSKNRSEPFILHRDSITEEIEVLFDFSQIDPSDDLDIEVKSVHSHSFERFMNSLPTLYDDFNYELFSVESDLLITGDSAVTIFSDSPIPKGLSGADQIYLPLGSKVGLFCFSKKLKSDNSVSKFNSNLIEILNSKIIQNSRKFLVSHPSNREAIEKISICQDFTELDVKGF